MRGEAPPLDLPHRPLLPPLRAILAACFRAEPQERPSAAALYRELCNARAAVLRHAVRSQA